MFLIFKRQSDPWMDGDMSMDIASFFSIPLVSGRYIKWKRKAIPANIEYTTNTQVCRRFLKTGKVAVTISVNIHCKPFIVEKASEPVGKISLQITQKRQPGPASNDPM